MGVEIERKFLVINEDYKNGNTPKLYKQGYIINEKGKTIRVRVADNQGFLTIKSDSKGITRNEYEYEIPIEDANELLSNMCDGICIEKYRYIVKYKGNKWEIDEFTGSNKGLVVAEIELSNEDQKFEKPCWIGEEVSLDSKYYNCNLISNPYSKWQ